MVTPSIHAPFNSDVEAASRVSFPFSSRRRRRRLLLFFLVIITSSFILVLYLDNRLLKSLHTTLQVFQNTPLLDLPTPCPDRPTPFFYPSNSSNSNSYLLFAPADPARADTTVRRIAAHDAISDACLEEWVGKGKWAGECLSFKVEEPKVDFVWTWVNGSDPLHRAARLAQPLPPAVRVTKPAYRAKQYREHDELRFSIRSAKAATKSWKQSTLHLVANSYPLPSPPYKGQGKEYVVRLGQVPQWLDLRKINEEVPRFVVHHDVDLFRLIPSLPNQEVSDVEFAAWRAASIPTFNSLAIESQLANLPASNVSENTVFVMDDNYFLLPVNTSAFYSPINGPVLHLQPDRLIGPPEPGHISPPGWSEWRGLETAASHLSERFGSRGRPYLMHSTRAIPLPLLHEASLTFPAAFSGTATSRFRGQDIRNPETHTLWLATNFIVERHREALLWSWVVAKWGGQKGFITREEKDRMWLELGGESETVNERNLELKVPWPKRDGRFQVKEELEKAGLPDSGTTKYSFVSSDGYPNTYLPLKRLFHPPDQDGWPDLSSEASSAPIVCTITRLECFKDDADISEPAVEMLKRIMVDKPTCGDCIISALIGSSGPTGFSAFLPSPTSSSSPTPPLSSTSMPFHLPLSLSALLAFPYPSNPYFFSLRLIQRYSYVIGSTPMTFFGVTGPASAREALNRIDADVVLLCVNDDLATTDPRMVEMLDGVMKEWMQGRWPDKLGIERTDSDGEVDWRMGEQCG